MSSFSQSYYPSNTGTPPVRIECLIMPTLQEPDPADITKTVVRTYTFEAKIIIHGAIASTLKGEIQGDDRNAATVVAYGKLIDALATNYANTLALAQKNGLKIEVLPP